MTRVRALSFDLDYTLWSLDQVIERAEARTRAFFARSYPAVAEQYNPARIATLRQQVLDEEPGIAHDLRELRLRTLRRLAAGCGCPPAAAEQALDVFMEARNEVAIYAETRPLLERLHRRYTLVALTNGNADIHRIGLGHYFRAAILAADVGAAKPSALMFEAALRGAGASPGELLHVGDDPETDVFGAARLGIGAVWVNRTAMPWPEHLPRVPHVEIRTLAELPGVLQDHSAPLEGRGL